MRRAHRPPPALAIITFLIFQTFLSGCQRGAGSISESNMMTLSPRLQEIFLRTKTVCFSRFLMQVPFTAEIIYGPAEVELPIEFYPGQASKLSEHLNLRLEKIKEERKFLLKNDINKLPLFGKVIDGIVPGQKIAFGSKNQAGYTIHSFIPLGNDLFVQYINSTSPENNEVPILNHVASKLQVRSDDEIPVGPGLCIEGGFAPVEQQYERVTIGIRLKEFPDVHISVDAHKNMEYLPQDSSLKVLREQAKESAEADGLGAVFAKTKIFHQQARQLNSWSGEEISLRTPAYKNDKSVHDFHFYSVGAINNRLHPELDIRFDSGLKGNDKARVEPSLTDEEALALWDKIITTIRIRQPSDATPAKPTSSTVPLQSLMRTGETCPQSGWWQCTESERIQGSKRRFVNAGEAMPLAPLLGAPGLWQKLTNTHSVRQSATVWQLVQYDDEPPSVTG